MCGFEILCEKSEEDKLGLSLLAKTEVVNTFRPSGGRFFSGEMCNVFITIYVVLLGLFLASETLLFGPAVIRTESPLTI